MTSWNLQRSVHHLEQFPGVKMCICCSDIFEPSKDFCSLQIACVCKLKQAGELANRWTGKQEMGEKSPPFLPLIEHVSH